MKGLTIQDIFLENIKSEKESGITFIEAEDKVEYLSYKKLYLEASYKLHALQQKGIKPGDEIVFQFQSNKNLVITFWACVLGRFIPVPIVLGTTSDIIHKINGVWEKLKNPYVITDAPFFKSFVDNYNLEHKEGIKEILSKLIYYDELRYNQKAVPVPATSSDLVFIQFSSGSTGAPKGVTNTQDSIVYNVDITLDKFKIKDLDRFLGWMPLTHDMGLILFHILPLLVNCNQFLMSPMLFLSNPELWLESLSKQKITISGSPNFGYVHVLENLDKTTLETLSFDKLRALISSAEPVSIDVCRRFEEAFVPHGLSRNIINPAYGLAEAVLGVSACYKEVNAFKEYYLDRSQLNVGSKVQFMESNSKNVASFADLGAYNGTEIKILNENNEDLLEDTLGIIHLKSPAITSGYYNDPIATQNVISHDGWLNTGDIGFIHNKRLVITGRAKEMIIISGQNYFPNDLDNLLEELPEIKFQQAISCNVFNEETYQDELFVFVHHKGTVKGFVPIANSIKRLISERIGITVKKVVATKKIPRTTSGKIQRYELKNQFLNGKYDAFLNDFEKVETNLKEDSYVPPSTDLEKKLANIWEEILGIERVGIEDNFFFLGGESLKIGILATKIQDVFEVYVDIRELFTAINFKDQEALIKNSFGKQVEGIIVVPKKEYYPISSIQKRLFTDYQINPSSTAYNTPIVLFLKDDFDVQRSEKALKKIITRHEILRTSFHVLSNELVQKVHDEIDFHIQYIQTNGEDFDALLKTYIKPFELELPSLIRAFFFEKENKLVIDIHHIVADGASFDILVKEFNALYKNEELSPMSIQYKDFTQWHEDLYLEESLKKQKEFWLNQFEDIPESLNLPYDFYKKASNDACNDTLSLIIEGERREKLREICQEKGITMFTFLLSAYYTLLYKLTYQEDIVIGTSTIGRWHRDLEGLIGMFTNLLSLRNFPKGDISFSTFLKEVNTNILECLAKQEYTFEKLVDDLKIRPSQGKNPLFNVMFEYYAFNWTKLDTKDSIFSKYESPSIDSKFDLTIKAEEEENKLVFLFDYNTNLFRRDTVECFASYFMRIIDRVSNDTEKLLKDIEIISDVEKNKILTDFNSVSVL